LSNLNNRALASLISTSEGYGGGYLYGGASVRLSAPAGARYPGVEAALKAAKEGRFEPARLLRTRLHFTRAYDRSPDGPRTAWNKKILAGAPPGTEVTMSCDFASGGSETVWTKTGPCRWVETLFVVWDR
jgi:hypothetical protein